jgi:NADPH2:quinone reductase
MSTATITLPTMDAVIANATGASDVLEMTSRAIPQPGPGEVLLQVAAAGINRPDIMQRKGIIPVPAGAPDIFGLEAAGEVVAIGAGVKHLAIGDKVMALVSGGAYAQFCVAYADHCLPVPDGLSLEEAAVLPEGLFTVWHNLVELGRLTVGETVLIHGGASGIGTLAIQLANAMGATVITTVGDIAKAPVLKDLGAACVIDYKNDDYVAACMTQTQGKGVDVVIDIVGGSYIARNMAAMATGARHVSLSFMESSVVQIDLQLLMRKQLTLTSSTMRPKSVQEKTRIAQAIAKHVLPLIASGRIKPRLYASLPLTDAAKGQDMLESGACLGKVALIPRRVAAFFDHFADSATFNHLYKTSC